MSNDLALFLSKKLLLQALLITAPVIIIATACGLIISILQAVTQIQDSSLSTAPKLLVVVLMLMCCGNWMLNSLCQFASHLISNIPVLLK